ncbi:MAG: hypothetical protein KDI98_04695, partial [Hyphomicrobiaceae bacterium]|nr:hypothetical protein [Hyphomicrobiaceae bacterium]
AATAATRAAVLITAVIATAKAVAAALEAAFKAAHFGLFAERIAAALETAAGFGALAAAKIRIGIVVATATTAALGIVHHHLRKSMLVHGPMLRPFSPQSGAVSCAHRSPENALPYNRVSTANFVAYTHLSCAFSRSNGKDHPLRLWAKPGLAAREITQAPQVHSAQRSRYFAVMAGFSRLAAAFTVPSGQGGDAP